MDITPAISTRYADYLLTARWRITRNRALKRASYRCERCHGKRSLEVHHRTYDRLGFELDADLEVVCGPCHADHHIAEVKETPQGIYLKLAGEALEADRMATVSDLSDAVKTRCAQLKIPYDAHAVDRALHLICASNRLKNPRAIDTAVQMPDDPDAVMSHEEAVIFLRRLGLGTATVDAFLKPMPEVQPVTHGRWFQRDKLRAAQLVAQQIAESIARCEALEHDAEAAK